MSDFREFSTSKSTRPVRILGGSFIMAAGAAILAITWLNPPESTRTKMQGRIIGVLGISVGIALCASVLRFRQVRVSVDKVGVTHESDGVVESCKWGDIISVTETLLVPSGGDNTAVLLAWARGEHHLLHLQANAGSSLILKPTVANFDDLADEVLQRTLEALWPAALAAFSNGNALCFGHFKLDRQGIEYEGNQASWNDIEAVKSENGSVAVSKKGKYFAWIKVPLAEVPNAHLFVALSHEHLKSRA